MALTDNLVVKVKAASGESVITDSVNAFSWSAGTGTATLVNDGTYGYLWRITGGTRAATLSGLGNWTDTTAKTTTIAMRFRITGRGANYQRYAIFGQSANNGQVIGNAGTSTGNLRNTLVLGGSSASNHALFAYTTGDVITLVHRFAETGSTTDPIDAWKNGGAGHPTADATANNNVTSATLALIYSEFGVASGETLDLLNFAAWNRGLTDSEAASVADDITQLWSSPNASATSGTGTSTGSGSGGSASGGSGGTDGSATSGTGTSTGSGSGGAATGAGGSGTFTTDQMENNTGSGLLASVAVAWTWYQGAIGAAPTSTTHGTGTTNSSGVLTASGLPTGAGFLLVRTTDSTGAYYQPGTVT